jgi:triosephosphate isomerase
MKSFIIANWKMNPQTFEEAKRLFNDIQKDIARSKNTEIVICPPFVYLLGIFKNQSSKNLKLGAQDCFWNNKGANTGEISPAMLNNLGVRYVIVGHSERRLSFGETDEMINRKIKAALKENLKVIFCVGEKERDDAGEYFSFLKREIENGLAKIPNICLKNILVAYEPIWAISSSGNAMADTADDLFKIAIFIRKILSGMFGKTSAFNIPLLYGGSVSPRNAKQFLEVEGIKGLLVGGASLNPKKFTDIVKKSCL